MFFSGSENGCPFGLGSSQPRRYGVVRSTWGGRMCVVSWGTGGRLGVFDCSSTRLTAGDPDPGVDPTPAVSDATTWPPLT
jgi:hypothetical protein